MDQVENAQCELSAHWAPCAHWGTQTEVRLDWLAVRPDETVPLTRYYRL